MFRALKHIAPRTKILFVSFMLILAPGAIISYLSLQSIRDQAENIRIKHNGTLDLVREKLENDFSRLITNLQGSLIDLPAELVQAENLKSWLDGLESAHPAFKNLFLIGSGRGLVTSSVSFGWDRKPGSLPEMNSGVATIFSQAETAEFFSRDLNEAIRLYREAYRSATTSQLENFLISRIGRCYFKQGSFNSSIREYEKILEVGTGKTTIGDIPAAVVAYSQISECYLALNDTANHLSTLNLLYRYLLDNPWDLESGTFLYYLESVREDLKQSGYSSGASGPGAPEMEELQKKEALLLQGVSLIKEINQYMLPEIESDLDQDFVAELEVRSLSRQIGDSTLELRFMRLPSAFQRMQLTALVFQFDRERIMDDIFPGILASVELGEDILVGILTEEDSLLYLQQDFPIRTFLVAENFNRYFPQWKVALFDPDGKSIEQLTAREKSLYLALFLGIITVMLIGIILMVYAVIHESEISRLKSEFVSNVSHELKTPLALIRMFGETLDSGIVTDEKKRRKFYRIIRTESERLTHLINNVLDFSRMDAGIKAYNLTPGDLAEIVRNSLEAYRFHISDNGFTIESELPDEPVILKFDADAISQVLLNLLDNAVKYSEKDKFILVKVRRSSDTALLSVRDHGIGIPKAELGKIFEKFYRISGSRTSETRGSGLGLTLAKHIIEAHGGTIEAESETGKGSTFTITLPMV